MRIPFLPIKRTATLFELHRKQDFSGISGTGHVLDGVVFPDGTTVIHWKSKNSSVAVFKTYRHFERTHVAYHGQSEIHWVNGFDGLTFAINYLKGIMVTISTKSEQEPDLTQKNAYTKVKYIIAAKVAELRKFENGNKVIAESIRGTSQTSLSRISGNTNPNTSTPDSSAPRGTVEAPQEI